MSSPQILLIDPSSAEGQSLQSRLAKHGYRCSVHRSFVECTSALESEGGSCVIAPIQELPIANGKPLPAFRQLTAAVPTIVLADGVSVDLAVSLMEQGAATVMQHPLEFDRLLQVIDREIQLRCHRSPDVARQQEAALCWSMLDSDERQIVNLLLAGKTTKAMAIQLNLSTRTIDRRRRTVLQKMKVTTLSELAMIIGRLGNLE